MVIVPYDQLSPEALYNLIVEFVTRPGTDTGYTKATIEQNVEMVKQQLRRGEAFITFDEDTQTANIIPASRREKSMHTVKILKGRKNERQNREIF
jgi:uncharacterized protein YheU (UPF0270 family)